jgi:hypothetical protein
VKMGFSPCMRSAAAKAFSFRSSRGTTEVVP